METEAHLLDSLRRGERQAAKRFYDRFAPAAMAIALRYVADRESARDVVQEAFVKMFGAVGGFELRGEGGLRAWVGRIVVNEALNLLRHRGRLVATEQLELSAAAANLADEPPDEGDVGRVPPDVLTALIGRLPVGYRTVLNLYVFEGRSHREIAQLLGIKPDTSASQYARAKALLGKRIKYYLKTGRL